MFSTPQNSFSTQEFLPAEDKEIQFNTHQAYQSEQQFNDPRVYSARSQSASQAITTRKSSAGYRSSEQPQVSSPRPSNESRASSRKRPSDVDNDNDDSDIKANKKGISSDGKWAKRFAWPDELHRDFVSAVFDVGLKHSSPSAILEQMQKHEQVTSERIKSHLQKYRLHRAKSKKEFMGSYDSTMQKFQAGTFDVDPTSMNCGEVAAHLAYSVVNEADDDAIDPELYAHGGVLQLPQLTDEEKRSPVGASMGYLMGLFFSLKQQLLVLRGVNDGLGVPAIVSSSSSLPSTLSSATTVNASNFSSLQNPSSQQLHWGSGNVAIASNDHQGVFNDGMTTSQSASLSNPNPLEENHLMKLEMQNQMAFQNKMRKLKEQELSKYTSQASNDRSSKDAASDYNTADGASKNWERYTNDTAVAASHEGNNEIATSGERSGSIAVNDEFWNSEGVDEDLLFEFLNSNES